MKYLCDPHVLPTVVPRDLPHLASYAESCATFSTWLHVDIVDGVFAPNKTWPLAMPLQKEELETFSLAELPRISYEFHLMTHEPRELGERFARAGAPRILGHIEAFESATAARAGLAAWRAAGASEVGLAVNLATPLTKLEAAIADCDFVQLMSIAEIGKQGRPFDDAVLARVEELHAEYPDCMVAIDGGITEATVEGLVRAGANRLCVGAAIASSADPARAYANIHERAVRGCQPVVG